MAEATVGIGRLEQAMRDMRPERGLAQLVAAMTLVAELQDFLRFDNPRPLLADVGLVPGEHSSGPTRHQGSITKAGIAAELQLAQNAERSIRSVLAVLHLKVDFKRHWRCAT